MCAASFLSFVRSFRLCGTHRRDAALAGKCTKKKTCNISNNNNNNKKKWQVTSDDRARLIFIYITNKQRICENVQSAPFFLFLSFIYVQRINVPMIDISMYLTMYTNNKTVLSFSLNQSAQKHDHGVNMT